MADNEWDVVDEPSQDEWGVVSEASADDAEWGVVDKVPETDTFIEGVGKVVENTPERMKVIAGGLMQAAGDESIPGGAEVNQLVRDSNRGDKPGFFDLAKAGLSIVNGYPRYLLDKITPEDSPLDRLSSAASEKGREIAGKAKKELEANQPNVKGDFAQFGIDVARAVIDMGPAVAGGIITKTPKTTLAMMGAQVGGNAYDDYISQGKSPSEAAAAAKFKVLAEVLPETIPVMAMLKRGSPLIKRMIDSTLGEGMQEMITSTLEQYYDGRALKDLSLKDAVKGIDWGQVLYEGGVGVAVGGTMAAAAHPFTKGDSKDSQNPDDIGENIEGAFDEDLGFATNFDTSGLSAAVQPPATKELPGAETSPGAFTVDPEGNARPTLQSEEVDRARSEAEAEKDYRLDFDAPATEGLTPRGPLSAAADAYAESSPALSPLTLAPLDDVPAVGYENSIDFESPKRNLNRPKALKATLEPTMAEQKEQFEAGVKGLQKNAGRAQLREGAQNKERAREIDAQLRSEGVSNRVIGRGIDRDLRLRDLRKKTDKIVKPEGLDDPRIVRVPIREELLNKIDVPIREQSDKVDPEVDDIMVAIAKLGGISREEAVAQGVDPENLSDKVGKANPFRADGDSFDGMAERLSQYGYLPEDGYDANDLLDKVGESLGGASVISNQYNPDFDFSAELSREGMGPQEVQNAVRKALSGESLGVRQVRVVRSMLNEVSIDRSERVDDLAPAHELLRRALRGYAPVKDYQAEDERFGDRMAEEEHEPEATAEARAIYELSDEADKYNKPLTEAILDRNIPDVMVARLLYEVIYDGRQAEKQAGNRAAVRPANAQEEPVSQPDADVQAEAKTGEVISEGLNAMMAVAEAEGLTQDNAPDPGEKAKGYIPPASRKRQVDMFGADDNAQGIHDKKEDRKAKERNAPEMSAGPGDLFTDKSKQVDIEDIQKGDRTDSLNNDSSWVVKNKETGEVIMETFDKAKVDALNTEKYEAVPILEHLQGIGKAAKPKVNIKPDAEAAARLAEYEEKRAREKKSGALDPIDFIPFTAENIDIDGYEKIPEELKAPLLEKYNSALQELAAYGVDRTTPDAKYLTPENKSSGSISELKDLVTSLTAYPELYSKNREAGTKYQTEQRLRKSLGLPFQQAPAEVGEKIDAEARAKQDRKDNRRQKTKGFDMFADVPSVEEAAADAALSPKNNLPEPTDAQKEAGNYKVGKINLHGLPISIENPKGSNRSGTDPGGKKWSVEMKSHYGYFNRTEGRDGDQVDVFLGEGAEDASLPVFVIDQVDPKTRKMDEHKVMMGFPNEAAARAGYLENYDKGWKGIGGIKEFSLPEFKGWLQSDDTKSRVAQPEKKGYVPPASRKKQSFGDQNNQKELYRRRSASVIENIDGGYFVRVDGNGNVASFDVKKNKSSSIKIISGKENLSEVAKGTVREYLDSINTTAKESTAEGYDGSQKYHQIIPEVNLISPALLKKSSGEIDSVSQVVAESMDFSEPVEASLFSDGTIKISDGHHRVAAAKQLGMKSIPVKLQAINANGEAINNLIAESSEYTTNKSEPVSPIAKSVNQETAQSYVVDLSRVNETDMVPEPKDVNDAYYYLGAGKKDGYFTLRIKHMEQQIFGKKSGPIIRDNYLSNLGPNREKAIIKALKEIPSGAVLYGVQKGVMGRGKNLDSDILRFGKYEGTAISDVAKFDPEYIAWLKSWGDTSKKLSKAALSELDLVAESNEDVKKIILDAAKKEKLEAESKNRREKNRKQQADKNEWLIDAIGPQKYDSSFVYDMVKLLKDGYAKNDFSSGQWNALRKVYAKSVTGRARVNTEKYKNAAKEFDEKADQSKIKEKNNSTLYESSGSQETDYGKSNKLVSNSRADEIRAKLKAKLGEVRSGIDPEVMALGAELAVYHIEAGARSFSAFAKAMISDLGSGAKPYLRSWYEGARYFPGNDAEGMTAAADIDAEKDAIIEPTTEGSQNATSTDSSLERDSQNADTENDGSQAGLFDDGEAVGTGNERPKQTADKVRERPESNSGVSGRGATNGGESGNKQVHKPNGEFGLTESTAGSDNAERGDPADDAGISVESEASERVEPFASENEHADKLERQRKAEKLQTKIGDIDNIRETLPFLTPEQQDDVLKTEARFYEANAKGMMFTNGTGTGKTYTGLGVAKRFFREGKKRILIVTPSEAKVNDWSIDAKNVFIPLEPLQGVNDSGAGPVVTTFANFRQNPAILETHWDLVIYDESHKLLENMQGSESATTKQHFIATNRNARAFKQRGRNELRNEFAAIDAKVDKLVEKTMDQFKSKNEAKISAEKTYLDDYKKLESEIDVRAESYENLEAQNPTKVVFLSASPFAGHKNVFYADGYLFDSGSGASDSQAYNTGNDQEQFLVSNFGYRMRYNKANIPEAGVDVGLMERNFNQKLVESGSLSGRAIEVEQDYSREFVLVDPLMGAEIDRGMYEVISSDNGYKELGEYLRQRTKGIYKQRLLEAIKAKAYIERVKNHLKLGRKIVLFHTYLEATPAHPFKFPTSAGKIDLNKEIARFNQENPDLVNLDLSGLSSVPNTMRAAFGDQAVFFNGKESKRDRRAAIKDFNRDNSGKDIIVIQKVAGKEGISLHDVTGGGHQRVVGVLALPTSPTDAIQMEGRSYRIGLKSDAIFEYPTINLNFEKYAYADTISRRVSTAENLAMGNQARDLDISFKEGYLNPTGADPSGRQGTGGKKNDRNQREISDFDRAKTYYYSRGKKTSKNKSAEGHNYFATPEPIGMKMVEWAGIRQNDDVLEPSGGHGAIARFFPGNSNNTAIEPSGTLGAELSLVTNGKVIRSMFEDHHAVNKYDAIVMNPPFGVGGSEAIPHLAKAYKHLKNGGRIVAILPKGPAADKKLNKFMYGDDAPKDLFMTADIDMPSVTFERAATKVAVHIVILDKTSADNAPNSVTRSLASETSVKDLFERIEYMEVPDRAPTPVIEEVQNPAPEIENGKAVPADLITGVHTKKGHKIWTVALNEQTERDQFNNFRDKSKSLGGYYSRYKNKAQGIRNGFIFDNEEKAKELLDFIVSESGPAAVFTTNETPSSSGVSVQIVGEAVSKQVAKLSKAYQQRVEIVQSVNDLPADIRDAANEVGNVAGAYSAKNDTAYLVAENIVSKSHAQRVLAHEVTGHMGMEDMLGNDFAGILNSVQELREAGDTAVSEAAATVEARRGKLPDSEAAAEIIAVMAENGVRGSLMARIIASVRKFLRKMGFSLSFTASELEVLIAKAGRYVQKNNAVRKNSENTPKFSDSASTFYSKMQRVLAAKLPNSGPVGQIRIVINSMAKKGEFKKEELEWSGINEWLAGQTGKITKAKVLDFLRANEVQVEEVIKGEGSKSEVNEIIKNREDFINQFSDKAGKEGHSSKKARAALNIIIDDSSNSDAWNVINKYSFAESGTQYDPNKMHDFSDEIENAKREVMPETKFDLHQLPGGKNYKELLLTLPVKQVEKEFKIGKSWERVQRVEQTEFSESEGSIGTGKYDYFLVSNNGDFSEKSFSTEAEAKENLSSKSVEKRMVDEASFNGGHYQEPNVLAHVRFNERTDDDGNRVLFIEEVQSDWHQEGRKVGYDDGVVKTGFSRADLSEWISLNIKSIDPSGGYLTKTEMEGNVGSIINLNKEAVNGRYDSGEPINNPETYVFDILVMDFNWHPDNAKKIDSYIRKFSNVYPGVPNAPFKTTWPLMSMKRMIRYAAENGFDSIAWTTGEQQSERYNLSNTLNSVVARKIDGGSQDGKYEISAYDLDQELVVHKVVTEEKLPDNLGKDLAKKIIDDVEEYPDGKTYMGLDLKVGGEGMEGFYDKMLPNTINKYVKKWGAKTKKVEFSESIEADIMNGEEAGVMNFDAHSIDITDKMKDSVMSEGQPLFSADKKPAFKKDYSALDDAMAGTEKPKKTARKKLFTRKNKSKAGESDRKYTKEQQAAIDRGGFGKRGKKPLREKFEEARFRVKTKLRQGIVDQFDSFRTILGDNRAWMMAHLTNSSSGAIEAVVQYGRPLLKENAIDINTDKKSLQEIFLPLEHELNDFLMWIAGNRAEQLKSEDRENLFSEVDIDALKSLNQGVMSNGSNRAVVYEAVRNDFEAMNDAIVRIGVDTGLIGAEEAAVWSEQGFYLPFYRMLESDGKTQGPRSFGGGLVKQSAYKKLKGADLQINDLLSNVMLNWNHLLSASLNNQAAVAALDTAESMGLAVETAEAVKGKDAVFVRKEGQKIWYDVDQGQEGALILDSLLSLNWVGLNTTSMKILKKFKRALTIGVTASPDFKVRNLIRDSIQAVAVADMSTQIYKNLYQGWKGTKAKSKTKASMIAGGGAFGDSGYIHGADPDAIQYLVDKGVKRETILDSRNHLKKVWNVWQDFGSRLENVNRAANFEQALDSGKDLLTANFEARDHLDFSRTGSFVSVRAIAQVVPFLNARLQGMDKLARSSMDKNQMAQFAAVVGVYSIASVMLYLLMKDDDDYKDAEEWERDAYHLFKLPGGDTMYRIPRPFEVGAIAGTMERMVEQLVDDDVHGELFAERLLHTLKENLSFNPMPQAFQPALEIYANKNSFTGRQIESVSMKRLSPKNRKRAWTSETAIWMSGRMADIAWDDVVLSPVQIESLVQGYFGWAGATTLAGIDMIITRPLSDAPTRPSKKFTDRPFIKAFARSTPSRNTKYTTLFYKQLKEMEQLFADIGDARRLRNFEEAKSLRNENKKTFNSRKKYKFVQRQLSNINARINRILISDDGPDKKAEKVDKLRARKNNIIRRTVRRYQKK